MKSRAYWQMEIKHKAVRVRMPVEPCSQGRQQSWVVKNTFQNWAGLNSKPCFSMYSETLGKSPHSVSMFKRQGWGLALLPSVNAGGWVRWKGCRGPGTPYAHTNWLLTFHSFLSVSSRARDKMKNHGRWVRTRGCHTRSALPGKLPPRGSAHFPTRQAQYSRFTVGFSQLVFT